ncbi:MAG: ribokinase [Oscillospiraceae bacterium]
MKIFDFGSLNIDKVYGVSDFVCGGETISAENMEVFCGGKGLNQSIAAARSGTECVHCGAVGHDGDILIAQLKKYGVNTEYIIKKQTNSGHAVIQLNKNGQNAIIVYGGANKELTKEYVDFVFEHISKDDFVLVQNETNMVEYIIEKAHQSGNKIAFNPSPITKDIEKYKLKYLEYLIVNETEGEALSGEHEPEKICGKIAQLYPETKLVLTLGKQGAMYSYRDNRIFVPAFSVNAIDTTGAGDTFTGYFLSCIMRGNSPDEALKTSCAASALAVMKKGASSSIPKLAEVEEFLKGEK